MARPTDCLRQQRSLLLGDTKYLGVDRKFTKEDNLQESLISLLGNY